MTYNCPCIDCRTRRGEFGSVFRDANAEAAHLAEAPNSVTGGQDFPAPKQDMKDGWYDVTEPTADDVAEARGAVARKEAADYAASVLANRRAVEDYHRALFSPRAVGKTTAELAELVLGPERAARYGINPKDVIGATKTPLALVPPAGIIYIAKVLAHGAAKYGAFNWRDQPIQKRVYVEAILRHALAILDGQDLDPDSGLPHFAHIGAGAAIALDAQSVGTLKADPTTPGVAAELMALKPDPDYDI